MAAKKVAVQQDTNILVQTTEMVPVSSLSTYDQNPRIGDVDAIAESMKLGQYKAIVVNRRDNKILAGNHTFLAARKLGWESIYVSFVDVDEEVAKRIVIADNRLADKGAYDDRILAELLASIPDITGTGYTDIEVDDLLSGFEDLQVSIDAMTDAVVAEQQLESRIRDMGTFDGAPLGEEPDLRQSEAGVMPENLPAPEPKGPTVEDAPDSLGGAVSFKKPYEMELDGVGPWGVTRLRPDMLMTFDDLPENLESWAGSATKDWPDEDQWWLYNWGIDSTSGMRDISKVIVGFYAYDDYFQNWWVYPDRYVTKLVNSKIKYMLTPDFSMATFMPPCEWLWQLHKSRFVGRYAQECGIKVAPTIEWPYMATDFLVDHVLGTLPHGIPLVTFQMQTIDDNTKNDPAAYIETVNLIFSELEPEGALVYASPAGRDILSQCDTRGTQIKVVGTRLEKLSESQKGRTKKATI